MQSIEKQLAKLTHQQDILLRINTVVQALSRPKDLMDVAGVCYQALRELSISFQGLAIHRLIDEPGECFESYLIAPKKQMMRPAWQSPRMYQIWQSDEVVFVPDLEKDAEKNVRDLKGMRERFGFWARSLVIVPHARGIMTFLSSEENAFNEEDIHFLKKAGNVLSVGITRVDDLERLEKSQQVLAQHTEDLARSNTDLEQFAYVVSHDLQEPLRMVTSYLQLLERRYGEKLDDSAHQFIDFAVDGAERMKVLLTELLAFSRVGTKGKLFEHVDCEIILKQAMQDLKVAVEESSAEITHDALPTVLGDDVQIGQVFMNLLGNGIKFQHEKQPQIHVGAEKKDNMWVFSMRDNGIGIAEDQQARIFEIFQRLHTRDEYPGTGMGLAICKRVIERHGGEIWVDSHVDAGTTFYFSLPDRSSEAEEV